MRLFLVIVGLTLLFTAPLLIFGDTFDVALSGDEAVARLRGYGAWAWAVGLSVGLSASAGLPCGISQIRGRERQGDR